MTEGIDREAWLDAWKSLLPDNDPNAKTREELQVLFGVQSSSMKERLRKLVASGKARPVIKYVNGHPKRAFVLIEEPAHEDPRGSAPPRRASVPRHMGRTRTRKR